MRADRFSNAKDALELLQREQPANAEVVYLSAVCRRRLSEISQARELLAKAEELGWPRKQILLQQAMCDFTSGDKAAEAFLLQSFEDGCDDDTANEVYECLVHGYLAGLYMQQAVYCIDLWIEWRPDAVAPRKLKAEILRAIHERKKEAEEYRELVRLAPDDFEVHLKFGELLMDTRAPAEALEEFRRCQELSPDDARAKLLVAACQRTLGELTESEKLLRECLDEELFSSDRTFALIELGQVAFGKRSYEDAADYLQQGLELEPANRNAHHALGLALVRLGRQEEGEAHLQRGKQIDDQNNRLDELMHEIVRSPDDPAPRTEAGEILLDQGVHEQAYLWLLSALRCDKTYQRAHEALARYYT
ncbi:MAG: tetratricopeptide repeat protein, partial [Candidatus Saccharimonadales bacterium]